MNLKQFLILIAYCIIHYEIILSEQIKETKTVKYCNKEKVFLPSRQCKGNDSSNWNHQYFSKKICSDSTENCHISISTNAPIDEKYVIYDNDQELSYDPKLHKARRRNEIKDFQDLLEQGEQTIKYATHKDAILLLGITGSGKSTLAQYITGNGDNLLSQEIGKYTDEFLIIDRNNNNKISHHSTITSHTIFPELVQDFETNTAFYDCPGFSDTRSAAHDISATYFTKKLIDSADAIKLVFVISHSSVKKGINRLDFMLQLKHAVSMIKNFDKFKDSIALIVTKVDNMYVKKNGSLSLVQDENVIENIASFLKGVRDELETYRLKDPIFYENALKFIDILLEKDGQYYTKIGIFRRPDEPGKLSSIILLQNGKKSLEKILYENLEFSKHEEGDFGYTISADSENYVHTLVEIINENTAFDIKNLGREIKKHYSTQEEQIHDIQQLYKTYTLGYDYLLATKAETSSFVELSDFIKRITKNINYLNISVSRKNLLQIENYDQYLKFIKSISSQSTVKPLKWVQGLTEIVDYLNDSQKWYAFLIRLETILSKYDIQQNINQHHKITNDLQYQIASYNEHQQVQIHKSLKEFLDQVIRRNSDSEYNNIKNVQLDKLKLKSLNKILDLTLKHNMAFSCDNEKLVMKGQFIKLSDIAKVNCTEPKFIEIFALNKVLIDIDFNQTVSLSIVAPTWEIIGIRQIILDGKPGIAHYPAKARSGLGPGSNGGIGKPGGAGGTAGNFLGIGKDFINSQHLTVSANGGKGGPGQHGGDGIDGKNGETPQIPRSSWEETWSKNKFRYELINGNTDQDHSIIIRHKEEYTYYKVYGTDGTRGGNGGDGGIGGKGGNPGNINIIGLDGNPKFLIQNGKGSIGEDGIGGQRGFGGKNGEIVTMRHTYEKTNVLFLNFIETYWSMEYQREGGRALNGTSGINGNNEIGLQQPEQIIQKTYISDTINNYKNYSRENLSPNRRESHLTEFINQLENHKPISDLCDLQGLSNANTVKINEYEERIKVAQNHIDTKIKPKIKGTFNQTYHKIELLIAETISRQNSTKKEKNKLIMQQKVSEESSWEKQILSFIKFVENELVPQAKLATEVGGSNVFESLSLDDFATQKTDKIYQFISFTTRTIDQLKNTKKLSSEELHDVDKNFGAFKENTKKMLDTYLELAQDIAKCDDHVHTDKFNEAISQKDAELRKFEQYENDIYQIIIPKIRDVENQVMTVLKNKKDMSHVDYIKARKIQSTLKYVKNLFQKMTEGLLVLQEDLKCCIDDLIEEITDMLTVYDVIERDKLASLCINSNSNKTLEINVSDDVKESWWNCAKKKMVGILINILKELEKKIVEKVADKVADKIVNALQAFRENFEKTQNFNQTIPTSK